METKHTTKITNRIGLNFKSFLEMAHIIAKKDGKENPVFLNGKYVEAMDMKFEKYSDINLKKKLLSLTAKFYGKIPNEPFFMVYDGRNLEISKAPPQSEEFIMLPDDWYDYAELHYIDGNIKLPTKG